MQLPDGLVELAEQALVLRPGDTLVIRIDPRSSDLVAHQMKRAAEEHLPGVQVLIVAADQIAAYRSEGVTRG